MLISLEVVEWKSHRHDGVGSLGPNAAVRFGYGFGFGGNLFADNDGMLTFEQTYGKDSLRPVTIKQMLSAYVS